MIEDNKILIKNSLPVSLKSQLSLPAHPPASHRGSS